MPSTTTCLVTGGAGFIGSHLVHRLVADGHRVRVIDNLSTGARANLSALDGRIEFLEGDIREPSACAAAVRGTEIVFHVAALPSVPRSIADPWASHDHNVNGTMRLLEAAREAGVRRVVYSSSSSVYGDTPTLPKIETMEPLCRSPYATAKLAAEQYVLAYARAGLLEGVALRYFNVFGPRQSPFSAYAAVIPAFLNCALTGSTALVNGDGEQTRTFCHVHDVVEQDRGLERVLLQGESDLCCLLHLRVLAAEEIGLDSFVLNPIQHSTNRRLSIATRPTRFLIVGLDRSGEVVVDDKTEILLVDSQPERICRNDCLQVTGHETVLYLLPVRCRSLAVVQPDLEVFDEHLVQSLGFLDRRDVDHAGTFELA